MSEAVVSQMHYLIRKINQWNTEYYENGIQSVSNDIYDETFLELIRLEKEHPSLVLSKSPTHQIFYLTKKNSKLNKRYDDFVQASNENNMLAQQNAFNALMDECDGGGLSSAVARHFVKQQLDISEFFFNNVG